MSDDLIKRLMALKAFLRGEEPLRGAHFGEPNPALHKGMFWWRNYLHPIDEAATALAEAQATIARLEAALRYYADRRAYCEGCTNALDMGARARAALSPVATDQGKGQ